MEALILIALFFFFLFSVFPSIIGGRSDDSVGDDSNYTNYLAHKGATAEEDFLSELSENFDAKDVFHDLYVERVRGGHSQIDLLLITNVGFIVIEVKNYSGWIFGNGKQNNWTQILSYGEEKNRFYNPVLQNKNHITTLRSHLKYFNQCTFFSVIVFYGDCELKSINDLPENTYVVKAYDALDVIDHIINTNKPVPFDRQYARDALQKSIENSQNPQIRKEHASRIRNLNRERV